LVAAGWYLTRPPSADALVERIEAAAASDEADELKKARGDIDAFLEHYPHDPRAARVQALADEAEQSNPIQRAYAEALRYSLVSPEQGLAKFTALVDAYDDGADNSETARHYVRLARAQQARLQKRVERYVEEGRKLIESRLAKADKLAGNDPAAARKIYQGIIELYRDKPWADDLVRRAEGALPEAAKQQAAN
jgi:serine/threonine-protein kinase